MSSATVPASVEYYRKQFDLLLKSLFEQIEHRDKRIKELEEFTKHDYISMVNSVEERDELKKRIAQLEEELEISKDNEQFK